MKKKNICLVIGYMISLITGSKNLSRGDTLRYLEVKDPNHG